jgi:hypothetical protein
VLDASPVIDEQRRLAAVGVCVHMRHLPRFYPPPGERPGVWFLLEDTPASRAAAAARLRAGGVRAIDCPPALLHLAANATRFAEVRAAWQPGLLWACIAPALRVHGAHGDAVLIVPDQIRRLGPALQALLPGMEFLRHERDAL